MIVALLASLWVAVMAGWCWQRWGSGGNRDVERLIRRHKRLLTGGGAAEDKEQPADGDALKIFGKYSFNVNSGKTSATMRNILEQEQKVSKAVLWVTAPVLIVSVFFGFPPGVALMAGLLAWLAPRMYFKKQKAKYTQDFLEHLPSALNTLASTLEVGHTVDSAIDYIGRSAAQPLAGEFRQIHRQIQMGQSLMHAVQLLEKRIPDPDVQIFTTAVAVQQKTGGNLSEILKILEVTILERFALRREVKTLSAEGRMSVIALSVIPLVLLGMQLTMNPMSVINFFKSGVGQFALLGCAGLQTLGVFLYMRVTRMVGI